MSDTPEESSKLSRRNFLKAAFAGVALNLTPLKHLKGQEAGEVNMLEESIDLIANKIIENDNSLEGRRQTQRELSKMVPEEITRGTLQKYEQWREKDNQDAPRLIIQKIANTEAQPQHPLGLNINIANIGEMPQDYDYEVFFVNLPDSRFHRKVQEKGRFAAGTANNMTVRMYWLSKEKLSEAFLETQTNELETFFVDEIGLADTGFMAAETHANIPMTPKLRESYREGLGNLLQQRSNAQGDGVFENGTLSRHGQPTEISSNINIKIENGEYNYRGEVSFSVMGLSQGEFYLISEDGTLVFGSNPPMFGAEPSATPQPVSERSQNTQETLETTSVDQGLNEIHKEILRLGLLSAIENSENQGFLV